MLTRGAIVPVYHAVVFRQRQIRLIFKYMINKGAVK